MALQQLLNRNKKIISQTYKQQQKVRTKSFRQPILFTKNNSNNKSTKPTSYLLQKYEKQHSSKDKAKNIKKSNNLMQIEINGNKFLERTLIVSKNNSNLYKLWRKKQIKSQYTHDISFNRKGYTSALQFYKSNNKSQKNDQFPKSMTSHENRKIIKQINKQVQILPDSFTLKSLNGIKGASCVFIEYQQNISKQGLHNRKNLQTQQQRHRQNRTKSSISLKQNQDKIFLQKDFIERDFLIGAEKLKIDQRPQIKKQYVNIFYQYRKSKIKYEKQKEKQRIKVLQQQRLKQIQGKFHIQRINCQPWRPISSKSRKQIDLGQFYNPQQ